MCIVRCVYILIGQTIFQKNYLRVIVCTNRYFLTCICIVLYLLLFIIYLAGHRRFSPKDKPDSR